MRIDEVYLTATGVGLPPRRPVADAVAAGEVGAGPARASGLQSVTCAVDESAPEMAVRAARQALRRSPAVEPDLVVHACNHHQGQDMWPVASYVLREAVGPGPRACSALEVRQMSNGGLAALDLAARSVTATGGDALVTTGDRFVLPAIDRWRTDPGTPYGDGGTAAVLSRTPGFAALRAVAVHSDPDLEPMHRASATFTDAPFPDGPLDFDAAHAAFVERHGMTFGVARTDRGQQAVLDRVLADADMKLGDADWVLLPHFGRRRLSAIFHGPLGIDPERTAADLGTTTGHLGAGDQIAGLDHLAVSGRLRPGQRCLLLGVGAGFSWGAAVVDVLAEPPVRP
jgi:3-oxoacyl-[acyl-carrier-protein] synthase III